MHAVLPLCVCERAIDRRAVRNDRSQRLSHGRGLYLAYSPFEDAVDYAADVNVNSVAARLCLCCSLAPQQTACEGQRPAASCTHVCTAQHGGGHATLTVRPTDTFTFSTRQRCHWQGLFNAIR